MRDQHLITLKPCRTGLYSAKPSWQKDEVRMFSTRKKTTKMQGITSIAKCIATTMIPIVSISMVGGVLVPDLIGTPAIA